MGQQKILNIMSLSTVTIVKEVGPKRALNYIHARIVKAQEEYFYVDLGTWFPGCAI